ncbi:MAG TPA: nucleotidyltransferase [Candidatus Polarisedimenticolaceae bacterium]|nr:nucleotidyltransferase [Candidatus Polarisedimenticolaceae bacterium]
MSQQELLTTIVGILDSTNIPYMVVGSTVSSYYGEPRSTHDIDIVIALHPNAVDSLYSGLSKLEGYVDDLAIRRALSRVGMFNYIDDGTGLKVDFWVVRDNPYDQAAFERRRREKVLGVDLMICAPEDTILSKLRWASELGGSEKQFQDALRVYEIQAAGLDRGYLDRWSTILGVDREWRRLLDSAQPLDS